MLSDIERLLQIHIQAQGQSQRTTMHCVKTPTYNLEAQQCYARAVTFSPRRIVMQLPVYPPAEAISYLQLGSFNLYQSAVSLSALTTLTQESGNLGMDRYKRRIDQIASGALWAASYARSYQRHPKLGAASRTPIAEPTARTMF
jgi:hypothetical protein